MLSLGFPIYFSLFLNYLMHSVPYLATYLTYNHIIYEIAGYYSTKIEYLGEKKTTAAAFSIKQNKLCA